MLFFHPSAPRPSLSYLSTLTGICELEPGREQPLVVERARNHGFAKGIDSGHGLLFFFETQSKKWLSPRPLFFFLFNFLYLFFLQNAKRQRPNQNCGASAEIRLESSSSDTEGIRSSGCFFFFCGGGGVGATGPTFGLRSCSG